MFRGLVRAAQKCVGVFPGDTDVRSADLMPGTAEASPRVLQDTTDYLIGDANDGLVSKVIDQTLEHPEGERKPPTPGPPTDGKINVVR